MRRNQSRYSIIAHWRSDATSDEPVSVQLNRAVQALGLDESVVLVVGGADLRCGFVDLKYPELPPAELRNALSFELAKHAPLDAEKLVWGYRRIVTKGSGQPVIRLVYMRDGEWGRWLDDVRGLGRGIDLIIPPSAVLDPLLSGQNVCFTDPKRDLSYTLRSNDGWAREVVPGSDGTGFGAMPSPLQCAELDARVLSHLPPEQQQAYVPAVLLAMYGLRPELLRDKTTWIPVPFDMRPQRYRYSRLVARTLLVYLLALAALVGGREYKVASDHYEALKKRTAEMRKTLTAIREGEDPTHMIRELSDEIDKIRLDHPSMTMALIELTSLTSKELWVDQFTWTAGKIEVQFTTGEQETDILNKIESSPLFADVITQGKKVDAKNVMNIKLQMYAVNGGARVIAPSGATGSAPDLPAVVPEEN